VSHNKTEPPADDKIETPAEDKTTKVKFWRRFLAFFGIMSRSGQGWQIRLSPRFFVMILISLGLSVIAAGGFVAYSTSPSFCNSCHIMKPYYDAWAKSAHKDVSCVQCHYPPGDAKTMLWHKFQASSQVVKYVTRTYSPKPYAEVEDASCLRSGCHSTRLLRGKVVSKKGIHFDHRPHLEGVRYGRKLRCVSCHSQIVMGKHIEVTWSSCYLCHLKGKQDGRDIVPLGGCEGCHKLPEKEIKVGNITYDHKSFLAENSVTCQSCHQDVIHGNGDVKKDRCITCHNQPEKLSRYDETAFIHDNHVTQHNTACIHCHDEIRHGGSAAGTKTLNYDCSVCHSSMHDLQGNLYRGVGAKGIAPMPSPMYLANVDCVGCHIAEEDINEISQSTTFTGAEAGCTNCHGEEYIGILDNMHEVIRSAVSKVDEKLTTIKQANIDGIGARLDETTYNLAYVQKAHAVHNIYYAAQVVRAADEKLNKIAEDSSIAVEDISGLPLISGDFCATLCHSKVGVEVPAKTIDFRGMEMPHQEHFGFDLACTTCHAFGAHKDVKLKPEAIEEVCTGCHEEADLQQAP